MADLGGRAGRRREEHRRRWKIAGWIGAGLAVVALIAGGLVLVTRTDDHTVQDASSKRRVTSTSTSTSTTTPAPSATTVVPKSSNPVVALAQQYDGYYTGTWTNTTYGSTGAATLELRIDPVANTLVIKATFDGDLFGGGTDLPRTIDSTVNIGDPNAAVVTETKSFGTVTGRIDPSLALVLDAPAVPDDKVQSFSLTGRLRSDRTGFDATYTVGFKDGKRAEGTMAVTCAPTKQRPSEVPTLCTPTA
jgi:hypothetical protein